MNRSLLILLAAAFLAVGCAPKLIVRHEDPTYAIVQVRLDGEPIGLLEVGDSHAMRVRRGYHRVEAIPRGADANPWAADGEGWTFFVDRKAELTLLPVE